MNRHWLVWLRPGARLHALSASGAQSSVRAWLARGLPCVVARQDIRADPRVRLGVCLPPARPAGEPRRIGFSVARADIARTDLPLTLEQVLGAMARAGTAPPAVRRRLEVRLIRRLRRAGVEPRVYGSWLWQALAGRPYVRAGSDLDLLCVVRRPAQVRAVLAALTAFERSAGPRLDGELVGLDGAAVAWRELARAPDTLLVKRLNGVALEPRAGFEAVLRAAGPLAPWLVSPGAAAPEGLADQLARRAVCALTAELQCYPKPGLVSFCDAGSHRDMQAGTMLIGLVALRPWFRATARLAAAGAPFERLRAAGVHAERALLQATGGVNTHRGALFSLGLLTAAAARLLARGRRAGPAALRREILAAWGPALRAHRAAPAGRGAWPPRPPGFRGAREEACQGFPAVFDAALPALRAARRRGAGEPAARVQALFVLMARLDDSNLVRRGGREGLETARRAAARFLRAGGVFRPGWFERAVSVHARFVDAGLSPGGCADLLACTLFVDGLDSADPRARLRVNV